MTRSRRLPVVAALVGLALVACTDEAGPPAADSPAPTTSSASPDPSASASTDPAADYRACLVTDPAGLEDAGLNDATRDALEDAVDDLGITALVESSSDATTPARAVEQRVAEDCDLVVTVGHDLHDATIAAARAHPGQHFAIVGVDLFDPETGDDLAFDNVREVVFRTDQAAFLAGYLAAGMTETGTVGTFGSVRQPRVTAVMDAFLAGVHHHEADGHDPVGVVGWDGSQGRFLADAEDPDGAARSAAESLLVAGADVVMPVAGAAGRGAGPAVEEAGALLIWTTTDGFVTLREFSEVLLSSVVVDVGEALVATIREDLDGDFPAGRFTGTLGNGGVRLAPFHEFEDDVPQDLKDTLEDLRRQITEGSLSIARPDAAGDDAAG